MNEKPLTLKFSRRNLPHWLVAEHSYFVTLRLYGTLPKNVVQELTEERNALTLQSYPPTQTKLINLQRKHFIRIEKILDCANSGNSWMSNPEVADSIMSNLNWLHDKRGWHLYAVVIMSNHVHILMRSEDGCSGELLEDLASFKRFAAQKGNHLLKRKGSFWAREDFDHWIRTPEKFESSVRYIANNPVKAGLVKNWEEWQWTRLDESVRDMVQ